MKIIEINTGGYKNLSNTSIKFNKINAIIALNNYGKSNLVNAINFGQEYIKGIKSRKKSLLRDQDSIPINKKNASSNFVFNIIFEERLGNAKHIINYSFSLEWYKDNNKGAKVVEESLKIKNKQKGAQYKTHIKRNKSESHFLSSRTGRCDTAIKISKIDLIINKLDYYDNLFYHEIINAINELNIHVISLLDPERIFKTINLSPIYFEKSKLLQLGEISRFMHYLKEHKLNKYELLINSIKSLLPNIEEIKPIEIDLREQYKLENEKVPFKIPETLYDVLVKEKWNNQFTTISNISSGSKKLFYILCSIIHAELSNSPLICLEELENSIHPSLLQRLLMVLDGMVEQVNILITSHSPYLIKFLEIDDILIGIPDKEGIASFKKIKSSKQNKLLHYASDLGISIGDFLFDMMLEEQEEDSLLLECTEE